MAPDWQDRGIFSSLSSHAFSFNYPADPSCTDTAFTPSLKINQAAERAAQLKVLTATKCKSKYTCVFMCYNCSLKRVVDTTCHGIPPSAPSSVTMPVLDVAFEGRLLQYDELCLCVVQICGTALVPLGLSEDVSLSCML